VQGSADSGRRWFDVIPRSESPLEEVPAAATSAGNPCLDWDKMSLQAEKKEAVVTSKMHEQSRNVYENKGSLFHGPQKSGNVIDYKGDTLLKPECC